MKYILKGDNNYNDPIKTILNNRSITEELFELNENVVEDYRKLNNIDKAIEALLKHINNKSKITIIVDCDTDGISSAAILYNYIKAIFKYDNLYYILHTGKQHGLSDDIKIDDDVDLILIPDASSNDYAQHDYYSKKGVDIIILDHHEAEYESKHAIVVNNQLSPSVLNKQLSGVGIVYKFLKALDDYLFDDKADDYLDMVALGNIADVMNLKEKETRYLCYKGIEKVRNPFLKALIEKNSFQLDNKYNINKIGWVIAPKLNGTIRSGTQTVKEEMFKAFISDDYNYGLQIAEKCKGAKESQDSAVKSALNKIEKEINLSTEDRCIVLEVSETLNHAHTGLVAGKLSEKYGVPTLLYRKKANVNDIVGGSGRGNINITLDFKKDLNDSGLFNFCEGHSGAFGFEIERKKIPELISYLNYLYKDKTIISGKIHEVDLILNELNLDIKIIKHISEYEDEWGNGIPEPLIAFENLMIGIDESNIKGSRSKNLIFEFNGVKFVKKFLSNDLKNQVLSKGICFLTLVGKCVMNHYNGQSYPQVEVIDILVE